MAEIELGSVIFDGGKYKLKSCPYCGSNFVAVRNTAKEKLNAGVSFAEPVAVVNCIICGATAGFIKINACTSEEEAEANAAELWNMRVEQRSCCTCAWYEEEENSSCGSCWMHNGEEWKRLQRKGFCDDWRPRE